MRTDELTIYRETYKLVSLLFDLTCKFPKMYKYTLGEKINSVSLELFEYIQLANRTIKNEHTRVKYLEGFLIKFELLKVLLRLCNEKRVLTIKESTNIAVLTKSIGKQATAWKNKSESRVVQG